MKARIFATLLGLLLFASCAARPPKLISEPCTLNSECAAPLGCAIGVCRRICVRSRDCGAGLRCLIEPGQNSGGCQLPEEATCVLNSECPEGFSCVHATCTLTCASDVDCPVPGSVCREEIVDGMGTGVYGCNEPLDELCIYDSDCPDMPYPYVCAFDGTCQVECEADRDCTAPRVCRSNICELP